MHNLSHGYAKLLTCMDKAFIVAFFIMAISQARKFYSNLILVIHVFAQANMYTLKKCKLMICAELEVKTDSFRAFSIQKFFETEGSASKKKLYIYIYIYG